MGLGISIKVKRQHEGYMQEGWNPKGTPKEIEEQVYQHLRKTFTDEDGLPFALTIGVGVSEFWFNVSFARYGTPFLESGYSFTQLYLAICEYIFEHFNPSYGIDISVMSSA